jgi:hypothetical protein
MRALQTTIHKFGTTRHTVNHETYWGAWLVQIRTVYRTIGWLFIVLATIGYIQGRIGDYMQVDPTEAGIMLGLGLVFVALARIRRRYTVAGGFSFGLLLLIWSTMDLWVPNHFFIGTADPLEYILRLVGGGWALYLAVAELLAWRRTV